MDLTSAIMPLILRSTNPPCSQVILLELLCPWPTSYDGNIYKLLLPSGSYINSFVYACHLQIQQASTPDGSYLSSCSSHLEVTQAPSHIWMLLLLCSWPLPYWLCTRWVFLRKSYISPFLLLAITLEFLDFLGSQVAQQKSTYPILWRSSLNPNEAPSSHLWPGGQLDHALRVVGWAKFSPPVNYSDTSQSQVSGNSDIWKWAGSISHPKYAAPPPTLHEQQSKK